MCTESWPGFTVRSKNFIFIYIERYIYIKCLLRLKPKVKPSMSLDFDALLSSFSSQKEIKIIYIYNDVSAFPWGFATSGSLWPITKSFTHPSLRHSHSLDCLPCPWVMDCFALPCCFLEGLANLTTTDTAVLWCKALITLGPQFCRWLSVSRRVMDMAEQVPVVHNSGLLGR